jgi:hypothetical protein
VETAITQAEEKAKKAEERRINAVAQVLKNPVSLEVSEPIRKMRATLMIVSMVAIFGVVMDLRIEPTVSVAGMQFVGLTPWKISFGLMLICLYTLIHFVWCSGETLLEWCLRCSGLDTLQKNGELPNPGPRQSTLMTWWEAQVAQVDREILGIRKYQCEVEEWLQKMRTTDWGKNNPQAIEIHAAITSIRNVVGQSERLYMYGVSAANEPAISDSLYRFERAFFLHQSSQNIRWMLVEFLVPVLLGVSAVGFLISDIAGVKFHFFDTPPTPSVSSPATGQLPDDFGLRLRPTSSL